MKKTNTAQTTMDSVINTVTEVSTEEGYSIYGVGNKKCFQKEAPDLITEEL